MSVLEPASDKKPVFNMGTSLKPIKWLKVKQIKRVRHMPIKGLKVIPMQELNRERLEGIEKAEEAVKEEPVKEEAVKIENNEETGKINKVGVTEEASRTGQAETVEEAGHRGKAAESGSAIISAVVILLLLVGLVAGLSSLIVNESGLSAYELNRTRAFYIAEAGIEYASTVLARGTEWDRTSGELSGEALNRINSLFSGGELRRVTRNDNLTDDTVTITSTAVWGGIEKSITASFRPGSRGSSAFTHSLVSRGRMAFYDNSRIIGSDAGGDLYSNDGIYTYDKFILTDCSARDNQAELIFPTIDLETIRNYPGQNTSLDNIGGNLTYISSERTPLVLNTPLQINGGGIMLVDGDLDIDDQIYFATNESFILIVLGNTHIKDISGGRGLIYGYGDVEIDDVQNFKGSVFAGGETDTAAADGTLICNDAIDVTFDNQYVKTFARYGIDVRNNNGQSVVEYKILSWTEL